MLMTVSSSQGSVVRLVAAGRPSPELLRNVRVPAHRAKAPELGARAKQELEGYPDRETLPPYRGPIEALVFGDFTGYGGSYQRKVPLTCRRH